MSTYLAALGGEEDTVRKYSDGKRTGAVEADTHVGGYGCHRDREDTMAEKARQAEAGFQTPREGQLSEDSEGSLHLVFRSEAQDRNLGTDFQILG